MSKKEKSRKGGSGWFYGIIRKTVRDKFRKKTEHYYEIHEIFPCSKTGELFWSEQPVSIYGESINDLRWCLSMMLADSFCIPVYEIRKGKLIERKKKLPKPSKPEQRKGREGYE